MKRTNSLRNKRSGSRAYYFTQDGAAMMEFLKEYEIVYLPQPKPQEPKKEAQS